MKKKLLVLCASALLASCGVNTAIILNHNQNNTQVQLSSNNYKIVDRVTGKAEVEYILMIGGLDKRQLFENAYSDLVKNAKLTEGAKALVNVVSEEHVGGVPPFYYKRTVTISANVIEFTK